VAFLCMLRWPSICLQCYEDSLGLEVAEIHPWLVSDAPAWRQQQQHFPAVPEQEDVQSWQQSQVGWPLGARAQQPYPSAGGPVGNVMQAFRGLSMQVRPKSPDLPSHKV
jgi:hypothetical protein